MHSQTNYIDMYEQNSDTLFNNYKLNYTEVHKHHLTGHDDKYYITVYIESKPVDYGAQYSTISEEAFNALQLNIPVEKSSLVFCLYSGHHPSSRPSSCNCKLQRHTTNSVLYIVAKDHQFLLGRD